MLPDAQSQQEEVVILYDMRSNTASQNVLLNAILQAQAKVGELSGLARRPWLESMAIVFAIDGARNSNRLWLAYLPEATFFGIRNTYFYA